MPNNRSTRNPRESGTLATMSITARTFIVQKRHPAMESDPEWGLHLWHNVPELGPYQTIFAARVARDLLEDFANSYPRPPGDTIQYRILRRLERPTY